MLRPKTGALFGAALLCAVQLGGIGTGVAGDVAAGVDAGQSATVTCVGDCDGDGRVGIAEIVRVVCFLLCMDPLLCSCAEPALCPALNVAVLIQTVNNALNGCPKPGSADPEAAEQPNKEGRRG
jgi:hypothetical protein